MPGDEGGDEPVRAHLDGAGIGEERQRQRRQCAERRCAEPVSCCCPDEQRSTDTDGDPQAGAADQVDDCGADAAGPLDGLRSGRTSQEDADEGRSDPVVESAPMFSTRRTGAGTVPSCTIGAPSAASVGATAAVITAATHRPVLR